MDEHQGWKNMADLSDFFHRLEVETELDYIEGKIKKGQRNRKIGQINKAWDKSMFDSNPLIQNNPNIRKIAEKIFGNSYH